MSSNHSDNIISPLSVQNRLFSRETSNQNLIQDSQETQPLRLATAVTTESESSNNMDSDQTNTNTNDPGPSNEGSAAAASSSGNSQSQNTILIPSRRFGGDITSNRNIATESESAFYEYDNDSETLRFNYGGSIDDTERMGFSTPFAMFLFWFGIGICLPWSMYLHFFYKDGGHNNNDNDGSDSDSRNRRYPFDPSDSNADDDSTIPDLPLPNLNPPSFIHSFNTQTLLFYSVICLILSYIFELCVSDTSSYLKNVMTSDEFENYITRVQQYGRPRIEYRIVNYHYETRWRTVTKTVGSGSNTRQETHSESYQERVNTHSATIDYPITEVVDRTYSFRQKLQARLETVRRRKEMRRRMGLTVNGNVGASETNRNNNTSQSRELVPVTTTQTAPSAPPLSPTVAPPESNIPEVSESEDSNIDNIDNDNICLICMDKPCDSAYLPCGHKITCHECGNEWIKFRRSSSLNSSDSNGSLRGCSSCPICRERVDECVLVYGNEVVMRGNDGVMRVYERVNEDEVNRSLNEGISTNESANHEISNNDIQNHDSVEFDDSPQSNGSTIRVNGVALENVTESDDGPGQVSNSTQNLSQSGGPVVTNALDNSPQQPQFVLVEFKESIKPLNRATEDHLEYFREDFYRRNTMDQYQDKTKSEYIYLRDDGSRLKKRVVVARLNVMNSRSNSSGSGSSSSGTSTTGSGSSQFRVNGNSLSPGPGPSPRQRRPSPNQSESNNSTLSTLSLVNNNREQTTSSLLSTSTTHSWLTLKMYYLYVLFGFGYCYRRRLISNARKESWWITKLFAPVSTGLNEFISRERSVALRQQMALEQRRYRQRGGNFVTGLLRAVLR